MENLPEGYTYDDVSDGDRDCQTVRIKEVSSVDSAKVKGHEIWVTYSSK